MLINKYKIDFLIENSPKSPFDFDVDKSFKSEQIIGKLTGNDKNPPCIFDTYSFKK